MMMMMMDDDSLAGAFSPVVFFDGEREIDLGTIVITPAMTFHAFRSIISQKIGISYHQLTIYFERTTSPHHHRRHPVTSKFNFSAAMGESSFAFFRVVLKRSRRLRRRRLRNLTLEAQYMDYAARLREEMEREKERYLMSLNLNSDLYSDLSSSYYWGGINGGGFRMSSDDGVSSSGSTSSDRVLCDVCLNYSTMESETVPFHWCKNDAVTLAFRSHAGPIGPPSKTQVR